MEIKNSFSKEGQDLFVNTLLPNPGFFLDVGCHHPKFGNNTYALEILNWRGLLLDNDRKFIDLCQKQRLNPSVFADCKNIDWLNLLKKYNFPHVIDYISLDVCGANIDVINSFPFDKYEFKIMTFETDVYKVGFIRKNNAIKVLSKYEQYGFLLENAKLGPDSLPFRHRDSCGIWEDWWGNHKFFNISKLYKKNMYWFNYIKFLNKKRFKIFL